MRREYIFRIPNPAYKLFSDLYHKQLWEFMERDGWVFLSESYDIVNPKFKGICLYWPHINVQTLRSYGYKIPVNLRFLEFITGW